MTKESELLVAHLSKEIELANAQLVEQRTKNNLWIAFGPFLILAGVAYNKSALDALQSANSTMLIKIATLAIGSYFCLGLIAAKVEQQIWNRANHCRKLLAEHTGIDKSSLTFSTKGLFAMYDRRKKRK